MIGTPYHAMLEYVYEKQSGHRFALATIKSAHSDIDSKLQVSFITQQVGFDGADYSIDELKGQLIVWQEDEKTVIELPDDFSFDLAENQISKMLSELNHTDD